jgi:CBS-domain-containing membrane protein
MGKNNDITREDLRAALGDLKTYIDITEEDLLKIYKIALKHAEERTALEISVGGIMTRKIITVKRDADFHEAAKLISDNKISGLPVIDDEYHVMGIVTETDILAVTGMKRGHTFADILRHMLGEPLPMRKSGNKVEDIMTSPAITITPEAQMSEAARIMDARRIKRLPVVDNGNKLIGIISMKDIVKIIGKC